MKSYVIYLLLIFTIQINAQELKKPSRIDKASLGLGMGLDYGGFGMNFTTSLHRNVAIFGGVGYAVIDLGYNVGVKARFVSEENPSNPFIMVMYGLNTVVQISNATEFNKSFNGVTFGAGLDFSFNRRKFGYWSVALLVPKRSSEANTYIDKYNAKFTNEVFPIVFSVGYKIIFQ